VNLATGTQTGGAGTDTFVNFENAGGSSRADTLIGNAGDNQFEGLAGNDTINGGAGSDWINFFSTSAGFANAGVAVNLADGVVSNDGFGNSDTLSSIENVNGSNFSDIIVGSADANLLLGNGGNDTILAADGNDWLRGGDGSDLLDGGAGTDTASYSDIRVLMLSMF
jgi:Ca2+-binding RTX toxin-like protein